MDKDSYIVVHSSNYADFINAVMKKQDDGYAVTGGIAVTMHPVSGDIKYYQAMVIERIGVQSNLSVVDKDAA